MTHHSLQRKSAARALALLASTLLFACATQQEPAAPAAPAPAPASEPVAVAPAPAPAAEPVKIAAPVLSDAQRAQLETQLNPKLGKLMHKLLEEAKPTLRDFLSTNACVTDDNGSALNAYALADNFPSSGYKAPMLQLPEHDKTRCLDVAELRGWKALTITHLRFEAIYRDSNGKTHEMQHELKRGNDNRWLMTR